jgi:hypothetical protein
VVHVGAEREDRIDESVGFAVEFETGLELGVLAE